MANERKNNLFKQVPVRPPKRSMFDLSHEVKMSGKFGYLYPVLCVDTLPGDTFRDTMNCMLRFAPMAAPIMHRFDVTTHFFFVPYRILCEAWQDFITGGQDGTAAPVLPFVTPAGIFDIGFDAQLMKQGTMWDYLGLPTAPTLDPTYSSAQHISVLPFRACAKVWNDFYRDPNLDTEMDLDEELEGDVSAQSVAAGIMNINKYRRGFEKDYFTSALPWAQRGAQVLMPLSGVADAGDVTYKNDGGNFFNSDNTPIAVGGALDMIPTTGDGAFGRTAAEPTKAIYVRNIDEITFDNAATTINDFRRALAIQRWLEANARGGARYTEQIQSHFNVTVPDYRLQRAEYLGGGKQPVSIQEVLSTATSETGTNESEVGDMYGHGLSVGRTNQFSYRCQEHGVVLGFLSVTLRTAYSQGIAKMWQRQDKYEFGWPELAHLGEQEILTKELFYSFDEADDDDNELLFGYIPRYAEYKFHNDRVAGDFRGNLNFWHESRFFTERPALDVAFVTLYEDGDGGSGIASDTEQSFRRIFNVNNGTDYLWMQLYHHLTVKRPLPYFGVPSII